MKFALDAYCAKRCPCNLSVDHNKYHYFHAKHTTQIDAGLLVLVNVAEGERCLETLPGRLLCTGVIHN